MTTAAVDFLEQKGDIPVDAKEALLETLQEAERLGVDAKIALAGQRKLEQFFAGQWFKPEEDELCRRRIRSPAPEGQQGQAAQRAAQR